tara:strand:- start:1267 stop:2937 length:1671 start_codon:yes stop_codon:yes gene_type:complete
MKVGRNARCPCGSGKKFKHCHGVLGTHYSPDIGRLSKNSLAQERIRQAQQGLGKPVISAHWQDHQFVAVGNKLHYSKTWKTFVDFLDDYIKTKIGSEWGTAEIAKPLAERHPLIQWYDSLCRLQKRYIIQPGQPAAMPVTGIIACYYSVAYGLYLLDHNVELQARLIQRLKNPGNFQGAYYELQVASAFLLAGFKLALEDEADPSQKHCEFSATSSVTGKKYWVEAKMRAVAGQLGRTAADGTKSLNPLSSFIRQLNGALAKPADSERMIFLDLNAEMPDDVSDENRPAFIDSANKRLSKYEKNELPEGEQAYLFVTNLNFHKNPERLAQLVAWPVGLGIPDFNRAGLYRLSDRYLQDQKHADAFRVAEGMSKILTWPSTFDGSLPSVGLGGERPPIQIGESYNFEGAGPNGEDMAGTVTSAIMQEAEKSVMVAVYSADGKSYLLKEPVSDAQLTDYRAHPDAYFGEIVRPQKEAKTPQDMFEFLMHAYAEMSREKLLEHLQGRIPNAETMHTDQLRAIYCEGMVDSLGVFEVADGVTTSRPARNAKRKPSTDENT